MAKRGKQRTPVTAAPVVVLEAHAGTAPARLSASQRVVLDKALRLGTDLADEMRTRVSAFGRWLLEEVFDNRAADALDEKNTNPVWLELTRRAGGPTLPLSRRMLYVAIHLAAYDKRITDPSWRALDAGRKEILLPLRDETRLRAAAQRVARFNLSQTKTRAYVTQLLTVRGAARQVRWSMPQLGRRVHKLRDQLAGPAALTRIRALSARLDAAGRDEMLAEIAALREALTAVQRAVTGR